MKKRILLLGLLLLAACGGAAPEVLPETAADATAAPVPVEAASTPAEAASATAVPAPTEPAATPTPPATALPEATSAVAVLTEERTFEGANGLPLRATLTRPDDDQPHPGVILLHMLNSRRGVWADLGVSEALASDGFTVLALDMRGHGETGGAMDWTLAEEDLQRVWEAFAALPAVDAARTAVVGASIGANMALVTGANEPQVATAVLLSPGLDYRGVMTDDRIADWGTRPLLIVASNEDSYAADSAVALADLAGDTAVLELYDGAGHGTHMFSAEPDLLWVLRGWLEAHLSAD